MMRTIFPLKMQINPKAKRKVKAMTRKASVRKSPRKANKSLLSHAKRQTLRKRFNRVSLKRSMRNLFSVVTRK